MFLVANVQDLRYFFLGFREQYQAGYFTIETGIGSLGQTMQVVCFNTIRRQYAGKEILGFHK